MNNDIVKSEGALKVYDAESEQWKDISSKEQKMAAYIHNQVLMGVFISATAIKKMFDEKLYLGLGCDSKEEYISTMLPYGRSQAYRLYAIGSKFNGILGGFGEQAKLLGEGNEQNPNDFVPSMGQNEAGNVTPAGLNNLGMAKLYELTRIDDANFDELMTTGKANIGGNEITIEEIKEHSAKELQKRISENKKLYTGKIAQMQEEIKTLKEEKKTLEASEDKIKTAVELEKLYGGVASKLEDKKSRLSDATSLLNDFNETIMRCGITDEDPQVLQQQLVDLIRQVDGLYARIQGSFGSIIINIG